MSERSLRSASACEHLVGHSKEPAIFKKPQLVPVKDLKLLVKDYAVSFPLTAISKEATLLTALSVLLASR